MKDLKARELWNMVKDLPQFDDICKTLDLHYDGMEWEEHPEKDVSDWHLLQVWLDSDGKLAAQEYFRLAPCRVLDLILGEISRRMGGCPCDKRLEAWIVWNKEAGK